MAGNIANADTPNYQARDYDFATALHHALSGRVNSGLPWPQLRHATCRGIRERAPRVCSIARQRSRVPMATRLRSWTSSGAKFAANAFYYEAGLSFITGKIRTLTAALQGQ